MTDSPDRIPLRRRPWIWLASGAVLLVLTLAASLVTRYVQIQRVIRFVEQIGGSVDLPADEVSIDRTLGWGSRVDLFLGSAATDADIERLCQLLEPVGLESIVFVNLEDADVTDDSLPQLGRLSSLQGLALSRTAVTGVEFDRLAGTDIESLFVNDTNVGDHGAGKLDALPHLQVLALDGTRITDAGLRSLKSLRNLRELSVSNTDTTEQTLAELAESLPGLFVSDD